MANLKALTTLTTRIDKDEVVSIAEFAQQQGITRSKMARILLQKGIETLEKQKIA